MNEKKEIKFRIAAVPEHFSLPMQVGIEKQLFEKEGVNVEIIEHPKGTGSMVKSLRNNKVEVAIALTEGLIADKMKRGEEANYKMVGTYVESRLEWASVAHPEASIKKLGDLKKATFGISRYGSGSHVMSYVLGKKEGMNMEEDIQYKVAGGMESLIQGVEQQQFDTFMWERFTIKPAVDSGRVRYIGFTKTPWPCFCIAIRQDVLNTYPKTAIQGLLRAINAATKTFKEGGDESLERICKTCRLNEEDAKEWFANVEFSKKGTLSLAMLEETRNTLLDTGALTEKKNIDLLLDDQYTQWVK